MQFSGAIKLGGGLDDYLTPAQNCVLPLIQTDKSLGTSSSNKLSLGQSTSPSHNPLDGLLPTTPTTPTTPNQQLTEVPGSGFTQMKTSEGDKAKITLADCLSCSGCVTTAESILISQHSSTHLLTTLNALISASKSTNPPPIASRYDEVVVSISLPSLLSIAALFDTCLDVMYDLLTLWLTHLGVDRVIFALESQLQVLNTSSMEFEHRYRNLAATYNFPLPQPSTSSPPLSNASRQFPSQPSHHDFARDSVQSSTLPLLSSECPGWVCLSEKTQGEKMIKFMSALRSPQAILGIHAKASPTQSKLPACMPCECSGIQLSQCKSASNVDHSINPRIFHVSIQPCYDKKLEATRECFEILPDASLHTPPSQPISQCCQDPTTQISTQCCSDDALKPSIQASPHQTECCQTVERIPYVDLVLSTHELVDMLVNNIQQIDGLEPALTLSIHSTSTDITTDSTPEPQPQPRQSTSPTDSNYTPLTPSIVSSLWIQIWSQYSSLSQSTPTTTPSTFTLNQNYLHSPQINTTSYTPSSIGSHYQISRIPGLNTSSGGYAETTLLNSLTHLFNISTIPPQLHSLEWTPVANNDIKAVLVEYLGTGVIEGGSSQEHGIYAVATKSGTILLHGTPLHQTCTKSRLPNAPITSSNPPRTKVTMMSIEDDFNIRPKKQPQASSQHPESASIQPPPTTDPLPQQCNCVQCCPLFQINALKYKQIKAKTHPYHILNISPSPTTDGATVTIQSTPQLVPRKKMTMMDDEFDMFSAPRSEPVAAAPVSAPTPQPSLSLTTLTPGSLITTNIPNSAQTFPAYRITSPTSRPICVLSMCTAFGLRNVQAIIRLQEQPNGPNKAVNNQTPSLTYHYVEVMSCPSGCINGGAQLTTSQIKTTKSMLNTLIKEAYSNSQLQPTDNSVDEPIYPGTLLLDQSKEAQITLQKALLTRIQTMYEQLPVRYNSPTASSQWQYIQDNALQFLFTKFNPIVANEQLQALRW